MCLLKHNHISQWVCFLSSETFYRIQNTRAIWLLLCIIIYPELAWELGAGTAEQAELICTPSSSICTVTADEDTHLECSSTYLHTLIQAFCVLGTDPVRVTPALLTNTHSHQLSNACFKLSHNCKHNFFLYQFSHKFNRKFWSPDWP